MEHTNLRCKKLNERYVVVDIETTGHSVANGDRIIQLAAVVIENGAKIDSFSSYVNPGREIPLFIEELTGISNEDVETAPPFRELIPTLLSLLEGAIFVAHNVDFDRSFLAAQLDLEGYFFPAIPVFDTVELSRILMPNIESYKLTQLSELLGYNHDRPHQADSDAEVTAELLLTLLEKLRSLPLLTLQQLIPISRRFKSDIRPLLEGFVHKKLERGEDDSLYYDCYRQLALKKIEETFEDEDSSVVESFSSILDATVEKMKTAFLHYEFREGQLQMMQEVDAAFTANEHKMIEAGTGTGKSLAYLIPAAFYAYKMKEPVVISTQTIPLQEQLFTRDLPLLEKVLPFRVKVALLKGRSHYLCLRKFEQSLATVDTDSYDILLTKALLLIWLTETENGDVEEVNLPSGGRNFWYDVQSDAASDLGRYNPWFSRCFYHRARRRAQSAHLVITNHALLCTDLVNEQRVLPSYTHAIIDEAHHLEETASNHLGASADYVTFSYLLQRLGHNQEGGMLERFYRLMNDYGTSPSLPMDELADMLQGIKEEVDELFRMLHTFVLHTKNKRATDVGRIHYRYDYNEDSQAWHAILECAMRIHMQVKEIRPVFAKLTEPLAERNNDMTYGDRGFIADYERLIHSLLEGEKELYELLLEADPNAVYWIEIEPRGAKNATYLYSKPIDVSELLADHFFTKKKSIILTSATLSVNGTFDYQEERLGLSDFAPKKCMIPSPFDFENQVRLLLPSDLPNIKDVSEEEFAVEVAVKLWRMAEVSTGKILVLFTAYEMLKQVYQHVKDFNEEGLVHLIGQGVTSGSRARLMKMFKESEQAILFGTSSFWEGIDLPGDELQVLVIVRLPFSAPDQPLLQAQYEQAKKDGKNPFMTISLPQAVIRFKQGFGRLIRTANDRGSVFVFDRRISTTRYGKQFIRSLPNIPVHEGKFETLLEKFHDFM